MAEPTLRRAIAQWFFMASLTGRYTSSPESRMEFDFARLRNVREPDAFTAVLAQVCEDTLTSDYWAITLPTELATSSPRSPSLFAYYASLVLLDAAALFSRQKVADLLDPTSVGKRSALERHHLFPKSYLRKQGIDDLRETNQIANYALLEWGDNADIADTPPAHYVPILRQRCSSRELERMYYWHALPDQWETMDYRDFLVQRRELIAKVIADGYRRLTDAEMARGGERPLLATLIESGETSQVEFKSTLRMNLHTGIVDTRMELACIKTIAGFLNSAGGRLVIGVADDGEVLGLEADKFANEDKMNLHLGNLIRDRMGAHLMMYIHPHFDELQGVRVLVVECWPAKSPVFVKDGSLERFYIRTGASTTELAASQTHEYVRRRFGR